MNPGWLISVPDVAAPGDAGATWTWTVAGDPGAEIAQGSFAQMTAALAAVRRPAILLLPTSRVLAVPVVAPARQQRQLQQALPFLLEENLAGEIEHCHVASGVRLDAQRLQLLAVDRAWFSALLATLAAAGIDPVVVSSEALALPVATPGMTLLLDGASSLLATSGGQTLCFDQVDAAGIVSALPQEEGAVVRVLRGQHGDLLVARAIESELLMATVPPQVVIDETPRARLAWLADAVALRMPPNLRQGAYAHADESTFSLGFDWQPLAWLAACWVVLALGYQLAVGISHARAANAVHDAEVALYKQVFPGAKVVPDPRKQMENQLRGAAGGASFSTLVAQTSEAIASLDKGTGKYRPRSLGWDAEQGQLHVDIVAHGLEDLELLRRELQKRGLSVDIGSGVSQDGGYKARMNVAVGSGAASS